MGKANSFGFSQWETTPISQNACLSRATQNVTTMDCSSRIAVLGNLEDKAARLTVVGRLPDQNKPNA
jgi:hypothetical protein